MNDTDRAWVDGLVRREWVGPVIVSRGREHRPAALDGFIAEQNGERVGLVTLAVEGDECEVVTLNALTPNRGVGTALMRTVVEYARQHGCLRLWLNTTNDNLNALRFYQRFGMRIAAVHVGAIDAERNLKPSIPLIGRDGIPIRDEIELELDL